MISTKDFYASPKYVALKAKVKVVLDADPEYVKAEAERTEARDCYREAEQLKEECDQNMAQAEDDEEKAEKKMYAIQKKVIYDLISDPEDAEAVYQNYY